VASVARLVTFVDLREETEASQLSVSARHEAVLGDGRHVLLLGDRGRSASLRSAVRPGRSSEDNEPNVWAATSVEDIVETARTVVGPDEPFEGRSPESMEEDYWAHLAGLLEQQGIPVDALELKRLPHRVELSEGLRARVGTFGETCSH
jgi:hypothetical protein